MDPTATPDATLAELASLGMRAARVVVRVMEIEGQAAELAAGWLPAQPGEMPDSPTHATTAGIALDLQREHAAATAPRVQALARALEGLSRSVRRTVALQRRIHAGWTGTRADTRPAMLKRQLARRVGQAIRKQHGDTEQAERLFDELALRLHDPQLETDLLVTSIDQIVARLCQALGLALDDSPSPCGKGPGGGGPPAPNHPTDTG